MASTAGFAVARRYRRSVQLDRDFSLGHESLEGYQLTPLVVACVDQVVAGVRPEASARAFSVIGPYGSGKSAFGLFLAHYLARNARQRTALLTDHGSPVDPSPALVNGPVLLPVLVGGNNTSLRRAVLHAVIRTLHTTAVDGAEGLIERIERIADSPDLDPQSVAYMVEQVAQHVTRHSAFAGVVLLIDELGQYLDYTVREGDERDLFVLQTLAEMCARSGSTPCVLLTILHQAFDRYAGRLGGTRKTEWAKVQGRFIDLPFQEPASQMIRMIGRALAPGPSDPYAAERQVWVAAMLDGSAALDLRPPDINPPEWTTILSNTYPIHPLVVVALPQLFRQLAQNERSLFAFLSSQEPWGLQAVLSQSQAQAAALPVYRLHHLYAYVEATLGSSLFQQARGRRWAELAETLVRAADLSPAEQELLITIGIMNALGQIRAFRASAAHLSFALDDLPESAFVLAGLEQLRTYSLIMYRSHRDSYMLFEGSDLDIDGLVHAASRTLAGRVNLPALLTTYASVMPMMARQFSYQTGAIRHFGIRFIAAEDLAALSSDFPELDGEILYVVPEDEEALQQARDWVQAPERTAETARISIVPQPVQLLREMVLEAAALNKVLKEDPQLEQDNVARREIASRLAEIEQDLSAVIAQTYRPNASTWWWRGERQHGHSTHAIDHLLSAACEATFPDSPRIWNELIVRKNPSSAASRARRNLIELMLDYGHLPLLGIQGFPAERAIYESVLNQGRLHRHSAERGWHFGPPDGADPACLRPAWDAIEAFWATTTQESRSVQALYTMLEAPPYGVKPGLSPLLFMAAYLARAGEISLYEHGSYVAIPDITVFERLLRQPDKFMLRLSEVSGARSVIYERLAHAIAPQLLSEQAPPSLIDAAVPLLKVAYDLPDYTKFTATLTPRTQAIRKALLEATAPDTLLFELLPMACEIAAFPAHEQPDADMIEQYFRTVQLSLNELQAAYPSLRLWMLQQLQRAFHAPSADSDHLRAILTQRYTTITAVTSDTLIRAFGVRLETANPGIGWVETVGALLAKKSMRQWRDADREAASLQIADLGRRFREIEQLTAAVGAMPAAANVRRIGLVDESGERGVVIHADTWSAPMRQLRLQLESVLDAHQMLSRDQRVQIVADVLGGLLDNSTDEDTQ